MSLCSNAIRLLIVDDHPILRQGIAMLLTDEADMQVVAQASNGREAIQQFRIFRPDVTLMDLQLPEISGLEAITTICGEFPDARFIVLTTYTGDIQILHALRAGARSYLVKTLLQDELFKTIRAVHAGKKSLSSEASCELAEHVTDDLLTECEVDILRLIANGNSNKQIAADLLLTEDTVKGRVKNILSKLGANDRTHAVTVGLKRGIIEL